MNAIAPADQAALDAIVAELTEAWNAGDAARYAAAFSLDGDQVNIFGQHLKDRDEIKARHDRVFKTIFLNSRNSLWLVAARHISPDVIIAHMRSVVDIPRGTLQGKLETLASLVFRKTSTGWELVTFHNTRLAPSPPSMDV